MGGLEPPLATLLALYVTRFRKSTYLFLRVNRYTVKPLGQFVPLSKTKNFQRTAQSPKNLKNFTVICTGHKRSLLKEHLLYFAE